MKKSWGCKLKILSPGFLIVPNSFRSGPSLYRYSLVAQRVKNPPAMWEIWVVSLSWEDPLEEGMTTYSSILA